MHPSSRNRPTTVATRCALALSAAFVTMPLAALAQEQASSTQAPASTGARAASAADPSGKADPQMKAVLEALASLGAKPIHTMTPAQARKAPTPTDAAMKVMKDKGMSTAPTPVGKVAERTIPTDQDHGAMQDLKVRVYTPEGDGPFPVVVYSHGGGWVIANLDVYDAGPRALCKMATAVVVSVDYRQGPEHKFPAAHEDVYAATQWAMKHADQINGDPKRVAVAGESAGGNMAAATCLMAKDRGGMMPVAQILVYPVTKAMADTPSYKENEKSTPLSTPDMAWFGKYYLKSPEDGKSPYFSVLDNSDEKLKGLPPATIITAEIDPLRDEGKMYADKLKAAGVDVAYRHFDGVAHEFFGMGAVVDKAKDAEQFAADRLKSAFAQ